MNWTTGDILQLFVLVSAGGNFILTLRLKLQVTELKVWILENFERAKEHP